jgi:hypothetical protein
LHDEAGGNVAVGDDRPPASVWDRTSTSTWW